MSHLLLLHSTQIWVVVLGALAPLVSYIINTNLVKIPEQVKAIIHVVVAAGVAAIYTASSTNILGWNTATLELLVTGVVAALAAHHLLWKPSLIAQLVKDVFSFLPKS